MIDRAHLQQLKSSPRTQATFEAATWDDATNSVGVVWYTGAEVARYNWDDGAFSLSFDFAGVDLSRYNAGAAVLKDHADHSSDSQIGKIMEGSAKIEDGRGVARVQFSRDPALAAFVADVRDGIRKTVSMGTEIAADGLTYLQKAGVAGATSTRMRASKWTPYELSFVPVPADPGASTLSAELGNGVTEMNSNDLTEDKFQLRAAVVAELAERRRAVKLAGKIVAPLGDEGTELVDSLIDGDQSVEQCRAALLDARVRWDERLAVQPAKSAPVAVGADQSGKLGKLAARALAQVMGAKGKLVQLTDEQHTAVAERFGDFDPRRMAEGVLGRKGVKFSGLDDEATLGRAFERSDPRASLERFQDTFNRRERLGEIGLDDLPLLFASASELTIMDAYQGVETTYQNWCTIIPMADWRDGKMIDFSRLPDLEEIGDSGVPVEGTVNEVGEPLSLKEYGRMLRFSRRALINDKWGAIGRISASIGRRVAVKRNALAYAKLVANPTLSGDSLTVFHATHGNVGTSGALSATTLGELRKKVREQKGVTDKEGSANGMRLNLPVRTMVVGSALELAAEQLVSAAYMPTSATTAMPASLRALTLVADAEISSLTAFYAFADPSIAPCFAETVLGDEGILSDMVYDEETKGLKLMIRVAHNVQAVGFRGAAYNAGV